MSDTPVPASSSEPVQVQTTVTGVVYADAATAELDQTLRAAFRGTLRPDRIVVLDASGHDEVGQLLDVDAIIRVPVTAKTPEQAYNALLADAALLADQPSMLWFLQPGVVPAADALQILVDALRRSRSASVVGPKLLDETGLIRSLGISATRSGRVMALPHPGEPDQGQHDARCDILAVPSAGMVVRTEVFVQLGGFQPSLRPLGADLDFCWRAHRAGHRVLVEPAAVATTLGPTLGLAHAVDGVDRRDARRVALARCAWWTAPFLALWIAVSSVLSGLVLLAGKRPAAAARELADVAVLLTPIRLFAVRWYAPGTAVIRRRDIASVFIGPHVVRRHLGDLVSGAFGREPSLVPESAATAQSLVDEDSDVDRGSLLARAAKNPGVWAVALAGVAGAVAARTIDGVRTALTSTGFTGGELLPAQTSAQALFHAWWDGWAGAGFGGVAESSPASALLAVLAALIARIPFLGASNPGGVAVALVLALAMPLAAWSAYVSGRIVTRGRAIRAVVATTYACSAAAAAAVAHGRVGPVVALIVLPLVLAGCGRLFSARGSSTAAASTALAVAVLAAFVPAALLVSSAAALIGLVISAGAARVRALILLLGPPLVLGSWTVTLLRDPIQFLAGPGAITQGPAPDLSRLLALSPQASGAWWWFAAPVLLLALVAVVLPRGRNAAQWALAALVVFGLGATVLAPRVSLGAVPLGQPGAGAIVHPWWGVPMMLTLAAALALVLVGFSGLSLRRRAGWRGPALWPVAAVLIAGALAAPGVVAWAGLGSALTHWVDPRPAIAIDQANGPLANRTLLLTPGSEGVTQKVIAREAGPVARGLDRPTADPALVRTIQALLDTTGGTPAADLIERGVGFVGLAGTAASEVRTRLDSTQGLTRMGSTAGFDYWRVVPPTAPPGDSNVGVARVSIGADSGVRTVPVTGPNAAVDTSVTATAGEVLQVAQGQDWATVASVEGASGPLKPVAAGRPAYALAGGVNDLEISTPTSVPWLRGAQLIGVIALTFLAIPAGRRSARIEASEVKR